MNFFQLIYAYIKKNLKTAQEAEDSDERKKTMDQNSFWHCTCFRIWRTSCTSKCKR